jgi:hypothetical protein
MVVIASSFLSTDCGGRHGEGSSFHEEMCPSFARTGRIALRYDVCKPVSHLLAAEVRDRDPDAKGTSGPVCSRGSTSHGLTMSAAST